jgi:hypothetical protein
VKRGESIQCRLLLLAVAAALIVMSTAANLVASSTGAVGASLSLESEMQGSVWSGPLFDLLVGLAVGASVAALFRAFRLLTSRRRSAA